MLPLAANAAGAVGSLWMALTLLGYPAHVTVENHRNGIRILGRAHDTSPELSVTRAVWDALAGAGVATIGLLIGLGVDGPFVLSALGIDSLTVGTAGRTTHVFAFATTPTEISITVGPGVAVAGAVLGLAFAFVRSLRRR